MAPPPFTAAPPPSAAISPVTALTLRGITFIALLVSVILIISVYDRYGLSDFSGYTYLLVCGVVGIAYTTLQIGFTLSRLGTGSQYSASDKRILVDFYGDKAISYLLATGAAAGFGRRGDLRYHSHYADMATASASVLLIGFFFSAVITVFSSLPLLKRS